MGKVRKNNENRVIDILFWLIIAQKALNNNKRKERESKMERKQSCLRMYFVFPGALG